MVIDELIVIENGEQKFIDSANNKIIDVIKHNNTDYHFARENEVTDNVCENAVSEPIIDMQIKGNTKQGESKNIFDKTAMIKGFLPTSGAYPTTDASYPNALYQIIDVKAGQILRISYTGSNADYGRIRYIDNDTNQVVGTIISTPTEYYTTTSSYSSGFLSGEITVLKDFKLGVMYINTLPSNFDLKIISPVPSIDNPIEIESVGDRTKNLVNISDYTVSDNTDWTSRFMGDFELPAGTYTISANFKQTGQDKSTVCISVREYGQLSPDYGNGISTDESGRLTNTFTLPEGSKGCRLYFYSNMTATTLNTSCEFSNIQIEKSSIETAYEPYGYKVPVKISGLNLINNKDMLENINIYDSWQVTNTGLKQIKTHNTGYRPRTVYDITNIVKPNQTYYLHVDIDRNFTTDSDISNQVSGALRIYVDDVNTANIYYGRSDTTYTIPETFNKIEIRTYTIPANNSISNFDESTEYYVEWHNLYMGTKSYNKYESYIEPTTTNIYLKEPLRKVKEYADYIDYKNKKVVRYIAEKKFTGTESIGMVTRSDVNLFYCYTDEYKSGSFYGFCNCYPNILTVEDNCFSISDAFYFKDNSFASVAEFKAWLAENNLIVDYIAKTPTEETINIPEISTADGTNIFDIETTIEPSDFKLDYWKQIGEASDLDIIIQTGSNILIISTGAEITQSSNNLIIGG